MIRTLEGKEFERVSREEYVKHLDAHPLAEANGFKLVGSYTQTRWFEHGQEIARESRDGFGPVYEILEEGGAR